MGEGLGQWEGSLFGWQKQLRPGCGSLSAYCRRGLGRGPRAAGRAEQGGVSPQQEVCWVVSPNAGGTDIIFTLFHRVSGAKEPCHVMCPEVQ